MKKLLVVLMLCIVPALATANDNINEEVLGVSLSFKSGVVYDFVENDFGVSYALSFFKYKNYADFKIGKIVGKTWQTYFGGVGLNIKEILREFGSDVKYTLPFPIELGGYVGYNWEAKKFNWGISAQVVDIRF